MNRPPLRRAVTAVTATAMIAIGGLSSTASSAYAATPHPAVGTKVTSTAFGDRVYTTYEKTGVLRVITGPNLLSPAELSAAGLLPSTAVPDTGQRCGRAGSLTQTCLYANGTGLHVNYMDAWGINKSSGTLNMNVRLYYPPPSAYHQIAETGYHLFPPGRVDIIWAPYRNEPAGTYTATTWIGGRGVNSLAQISVY